MGIVVTEPLKTVEGILTKAIAAESQLFYIVQREDYFIRDVTAGTSSGSEFRIPNTPISDFSIGDSVYLKTDDSLYKGFFTVTAIEAESGGEAGITVETPYLGSSLGGYLNNLSTRLNYFLSVNILDSNNVSLFSSVFRYVPSQKGIAIIDVGPIMLLHQLAPNTFTFSKEYYLTIAESWEGVSPAFAIDKWVAGPTKIYILGDKTSDFNGLSIYYVQGCSVAEYNGALNQAFSNPSFDGTWTILTVDTTFTTTPTIQGSVGVSDTQTIQTTLLQSITARKQLLDIGGANMWENLLRAGGSNLRSVNYREQGASIEEIDVTGGEEPWTNNNSNLLSISLNASKPLAKSLVWDKPLTPNTLVGTLARFKITLSWSVTSFVSSGTLRLDMVGITADRLTAVIWTNVGLTISGDASNTNITYDVEVAAPAGAENFAYIAWRPTMSGDFSVGINIQMVTISNNLEWSTSPIAMFLTKFKIPRMWKAWNRTVSVLMDSEFENRTGDANGYTYRQNGYNINKFFSGGSLSKLVNKDVGINTHKIDSQDFAYIGITATQYNNSPLYSEELFYKVEDECPQPIMLDWINSIGGIDQWLFGMVQEITDEIGEGIIAEQPISSDIEFINRTKQRFPGARVQRIMLKAESLTADQIGALHEIKQTNSLRVYLSKDGSHYIDAIVSNTLTTTVNTKLRLFDFNVEIEFPDDFNFFKAKLY